MTFHLKNKFSLLASVTTIGGVALLTGCGGGGGGGSSPAPTPGPPTPFDATYNATFTPAQAIPADGNAPTGALTIDRGRGRLQTTFFLQPSVVRGVQAAIDKGLNDNNVGTDIPNNQVPQSIVFTGSGLLDGNGKLVLTSKQTVKVCGTATLTIDPNFTTDGTTSTGTGTYQITFPNNLVAQVRGTLITIRASPSGTPFTCNNLPLRTGTVAFNR